MSAGFLQAPAADRAHLGREVDAYRLITSVVQGEEHVAWSMGDFQDVGPLDVGQRGPLPIAPGAEGYQPADGIIRPGQLVVQKMKAETNQPDPISPELSGHGARLG